MTIKQRLREAIARQPMTARELSGALRLRLRVVQVMLNEMRDEVAPCGSKREARRGPQSFIWRAA